jgi:antitoxin VapB
MNKQDKIAKGKQLNLKDPEVRELAEELSRRTGETLTGAIKSALREKLDRDAGAENAADRYERMMAVVRGYSEQIGPRTMTDEEAVGYDENGLPT